MVWTVLRMTGALPSNLGRADRRLGVCGLNPAGRGRPGCPAKATADVTEQAGRRGLATGQAPHRPGIAPPLGLREKMDPNAARTVQQALVRLPGGYELITFTLCDQP